MHSYTHRCALQIFHFECRKLTFQFGKLQVIASNQYALDKRKKKNQEKKIEKTEREKERKN